MVPQWAASTSAAPAAAALRDTRRLRQKRDGGRPDPRTPELSVRRLVSWSSVAALVALLLATSTGTAVAADATAGAVAAPIPAQQSVVAAGVAVPLADSAGDRPTDEQKVQANPRQGDDEPTGHAAESLFERSPGPLLVLGGILLVVAARAGWKFYRWYRSPIVVKISEQ